MCPTVYEIQIFLENTLKFPICQYAPYIPRPKGRGLTARLINDYIEMLSREGTLAGLPYVKHIEGNIWELRPLKDRIFFVAWYNGSYVLLHHFRKETQKTPAREIEKARREYEDLKERGL